MKTKLTLFPEDSPANHSPMQAKKQAREIIVSSGRKCLASLKSVNHGGSLQKMFTESLLLKRAWYSTRCALIWKIKGTKYNRLLFRLVVKMHPTDETECGLLPTMWATPNTMDHLPPRNEDECSTNQKNREGRSRSGNLREQVVHPKMWPLNVSSHSPQTGTLNPEWVDWLMGFPPGWTDLPD